MQWRFTDRNSRVVVAGLLILIVALVDWRVDPPFAFAFLYLFPILLIASVQPRWQIVLAALVCTFLSDYFDPYPFTAAVALPQDLLVFTSLAGTGLFSYEVSRSRERERRHLRELEEENSARRSAEEQLEFLIGSSPVAILTMGADGLVLRANQAAHRLFGLADGQLTGKSIRSYVPALGRVPFLGDGPPNFRTEMQCRGMKSDGEVFLADVFFSTYRTAQGPRLAALVVDASDQLREREETSLEQLMAGSRILVGAVSHEVRNVCGAIAVIHENLVRHGALKGNKDFEALGSLLETLNRIASVELKSSRADAPIGGIDLAEIFDDLRIVLEPFCQEAEIEVSWNVPADLPPVWADRHRLLQVLLNLTKNSQRALEHSPVKRMEISATAHPDVVSIRVTDSGPGIRSTEHLFQPFQEGAESTGLGLYISRAFARSFYGELRHDPAVAGCSFVIDLAISGLRESDYGAKAKHGTYSTLTA